MIYVPLHQHSDASLLDGLSKPWQIAKRVHKIGAKAAALTDHGAIANAPLFQKAMREACKHCGLQKYQHGHRSECKKYEKGDLKAILGCEFYVSWKDATIRERTTSHMCALAKNKQGWQNMVRAVSESNKPENFYYKPRLSLERFAEFADGHWITFSGHPGSYLADFIFTDAGQGYNAGTEEKCRDFLKSKEQLSGEVFELAKLHERLFGKGNFYVEIQTFDSANFPAAAVIGETMRWISRETGIPGLATHDAHYPEKQDAIDQRIELCSTFGYSLSEAETKLKNGEDFGLSGFFRSAKYYILSHEEMAECNTVEELNNTLVVADQCETYEITGPPRLPSFPTPNGESEISYLRKLCEDSFSRKVPKGKEQEYRERLEHELGVLDESGLGVYFLIVWDICRYAQQVLKCKPSYGRGSAAGCLVSYLIGITAADPIKYKLLFSRFYSAERKGSLPDIDMDFPAERRPAIIDYIRDKYGHDKVAQMSTYGRMQGRSALTTVLRAHDWGTHELRKEITKHIPDEAAIADELQEMREETGEASILRWALENNGDKLKDYAYLDENGDVKGPIGMYFEQAIRMEGTKQSRGKHAAGIVIFPEPLANHFPMLYEKETGQPTTAYDMTGVEASGGVKLDALGLYSLDKCQLATHIARTGSAARPVFSVQSKNDPASDINREQQEPSCVGSSGEAI